MSTTAAPLILNVDDSEENRYVVTRALEGAGFAVRNAVSGEEALAILERADPKPELILLDVRLPGIDGFEVCRRIKSDPATANIPVVQISAYFTTSEDRVRGLEGGADAYLPGSVSAAELVATARAMLRASAAESAVRELRASEARYRRIVETLNEGLWEIDPEGRTRFVNDRLLEMFGYTREEMLGRSAFDCLFPEDLEHSREHFGRRVAGESAQAEFRFRRADGSELWALCNAAPLHDLSGEFSGALAALTDVTDRRRAQEALRDEHRRKDEFLAMLSHELRNPLASILNAVGAMEREGSPEPAAARQRQIITRQVRHLSRILDDLLDVARFTQGKAELRREVLDLRQVAEYTVDHHRAAAVDRGHELHLRLPASPLHIYADPTRIQQVIANLLSNAVKYTPPGGRISIELAGEQDEAVVRVRDNGVGITPELLPHVFTLFTQESRSLARSEGGLGIGLTLVKRLVEMHDGTVCVESAGPGRGATFTVRLPCIDEAPAEEQRTGAAPPTGRRVLIVEDSPDAAETLGDLLDAWGHEYATAATGPAALDAAPAFRPEVVLLDVGLPGLDGYEVARRLRAGGFAGVLIALTGYGGPADRERARDAGIDVHLVKPVAPDALRAAIAGAVRG